MTDNTLGIFLGLGIIAALEGAVYLVSRKPKEKHVEESTSSGDSEVCGEVSNQKPPISGSAVVVKSAITVATALFLFVGFLYGLKYLSSCSISAHYGVEIEPLWWSRTEVIAMAALVGGIASVLAVLAYMLFLYILKPKHQTLLLSDFSLTKSRAWRHLAISILVSVSPRVFFIVAPFLMSATAVDAFQSAYPKVYINDSSLVKLVAALSFDQFDVDIVTGDEMNALERNLAMVSHDRQYFGIMEVTHLGSQAQSAFSYKWKGLRRDAHLPDSAMGSVTSTSEIGARLKLVRILYSILDILPSEILIDSVSEDSPQYRYLMQGCLAFTDYTDSLINYAIACFDSAIALDSNYMSPYLYNSFCYVLLEDRMLAGKNNDDFCDVGTLIDLYPKLSANYSERHDFYISRVLGKLPASDHPVILKVQADRAYLKGKNELIRERLDELRGTGKSLLQDRIDMARYHFEKSKGIYVEALHKSPRNFKLRFNLGLTYSNLYETEYLAGNMNLARVYLELVVETMHEALDACSYNPGAHVLLANTFIEKYRRFEPTNDRLLEDADSLSKAIIQNPTHATSSGGSISEALCCRALVALEQSKKSAALRHQFVDLALQYLVKAEKTHHANICWAILMDERFVQIADLLNGGHFKSVEQLYESWKSRELSLISQR